MRYLTVSVEATGVIPEKANWDVNYLKFPKIVRLAWVIHEDITFLSKEDHIIKPDGYEIPIESSDIHGITTQKAHKNGDCIKFVLEKLRKDLKSVDKVIGFDLFFVCSVLRASIKCNNYNIEDFLNYFDYVNRVDVMTESTRWMNIRMAEGFKFPSLEKLHWRLFNKKFRSHSKSNIEDCIATAHCYIRLKEIGVIDG